MTIVPPNRPRLTLDGPLARLLKGYGLAESPAARLVGIRGYYRDSMGEPGRNDLGLYDDAIVLLGPTTYQTFNANVDPSRLHDGVASLVAGAVYWYKIGIHGLSKPADKRYKALVQARPVEVQRHHGPRERGWFGINIHRGGWQTTGSEGCQTIHPKQWTLFLMAVELELERAHQVEIPYLLVDAGELT